VTGKVVNLSRARKARARDDKRRKADANAARHGRTRGKREADRVEAVKTARDLDAHRRGDDEP
jgi:hypothetical protein